MKSNLSGLAFRIFISVLMAVSGGCSLRQSVASRTPNTLGSQPTTASSPAEPVAPAALPPSGAPPSARIFSGRIGDQYEIEMRLQREGANLSGSYFYTNKKTNIGLKGSIDDRDNLTLKEFDSNGTETGIFKGRWVDYEKAGESKLEGAWSKPDNGNTMAFSLLEEPINFSGGTALATKEVKEENKKSRYEIDVKYPQLTGPDPARVDAFNRAVTKFVQEKTAGFKKDMSETVANAPQGLDGNSYIDIDYSVGIADDNLVSLGFEIDSYYLGAAHPNHNSDALNFDLKTGRLLKLADLFKPGANYLRTISDYAIKDLKKRMQEDDPKERLLNDDDIQSGASPKPENYRTWVVTKKELSITFDPYQVGPYVLGPQEVLIPYAALKEIIDPQGPLAALAG